MEGLIVTLTILVGFFGAATIIVGAWAVVLRLLRHHDHHLYLQRMKALDH